MRLYHWYSCSQQTGEVIIEVITSYIANDTLEKVNSAPTPSHGSYATQVRASSTGDVLVGFSGKLTAADASLKISALRSATALQKYREGAYHHM